jgi:dihydrolipoamide dehydrogenase
VVLAEAPKYDLVVIGSGPGGYVAAIRAGQLGLKTAIVEKDDKWGGTCLHVGCIPTKDLLLSADVYDYVKNAKEFGIIAKDVSVDWPAILARKTKVVTKLAKGVEFLLKKNKVDMIRGLAKISGPGKISVTDPKGVTQEITAKNIVLATGSEARMLPGLEADGKTLLTNKEILSLPAIPKSMVIIGAGAVGVEFASIFSAFRDQGHGAGNAAARLCRWKMRRFPPSSRNR